MAIMIVEGNAMLADGVPVYLTNLPRWLLWRTEQRVNRKTGETVATKAPISYHTSKHCDVTSPRSWTTFANAMAALGKSHAWDGVGIALGEVTELGEILIGLDLDTCLDEDGALADWAMPFLVAMASYAEISPSGSGIKCIARVRLADLAMAGKLLDVPEGDRDQARTRTFGQRTNGHHAPGAQLFLGRRYFTVTGRHWVASPEDVTPLTVGQLAQLAHLFGPKEQRTPGASRANSPVADAHDTEPDEAGLRDRLGAAFLRNPRLKERWEGGTQGLADITRSGRDMSVLAMLVAAGFTKGEIRAALRLFEYGKVGEEPERYFEQMWSRTKATPHLDPEPPDDWEKLHPPLDKTEPGKGDETSLSPVADADITPPEFSENALSYLFSARHAANLLYVHEWARWLRWDDHRWLEDRAISVFDKARRICAEQGEIARRVLVGGAKVAAGINKAATAAAIERLARHHHRHVRPADDFDADPLLLNAATTTGPLEDQIVREQRREDLCTKQVTIDPDLGADCPLWQTFLLRVMDTDVAMVDYLQRVCGYCLAGLTDEHVLFFAHGTGANGKSTFANVLTGILGIGTSGYAAIAPIATFTASHTEQHPTDLAMLRGARLVVAQETEEGRSWAISKIKMMTGGDQISARFMRQDFFTYTPQFKLLILGNHKPALHNIDEATRRRFHLIPFTVTIPEAERDHRLAEKLKAEYPAILGWMMRGFQEWRRIGLAPPPQVRAASAAYFADEDTVAAWIAECCDTGRAFYDTLVALYPSWKAWAEAHGERPGPSKELAKALDTRAELIRHDQPGTKRAGWRGLMVKPPPKRWDDAP